MVKSSDRIISNMLRGNLGGQLKVSDFDSALAVARALEKRKGAASADLARRYMGICSLGVALGKYREVIEFSIKWLKIEQDPQQKRRALICMTEAVRKIEALGEKEQIDLKSKIASFAKELDFTSMNLESKKCWLFILQQLSKNKFLPQQLYLAESSFEEETDRDMRAHIANTYLLVVKRIKHFEGREVDQDKVREKAEYLIQSAPHIIKDREVFDVEVFHTFVINLIWNDLWDLVDKAVEIYRPEASDPIRYYVELARKRRKDAGEAYEEMNKTKPLEKIEISPFHQTIITELQLLQIQITNDYLEQRKKRIDEGRIELSGSLLAEVLLSARGAFPEITKKIRMIRGGPF